MKNQRGRKMRRNYILLIDGAFKFSDSQFREAKKWAEETSYGSKYSDAEILLMAAFEGIIDPPNYDNADLTIERSEEEDFDE